MQQSIFQVCLPVPYFERSSCEFWLGPRSASDERFCFDDFGSSGIVLDDFRAQPVGHLWSLVILSHH